MQKISDNSYREKQVGNYIIYGWGYYKYVRPVN